MKRYFHFTALTIAVTVAGLMIWLGSVQAQAPAGGKGKGDAKAAKGGGGAP